MKNQKWIRDLKRLVVKMRVREGNNVRLTGKDLRDYIKKRFPDTCLVCLGRPSKTPKCKRCGGTGMRNEV